MYGTNDANNYGGYPHGPLTIAAYRKNLSAIVERELYKGAAVLVMGPPRLQDYAANSSLRPYVRAARAVAMDYGVDFVDAAEQLDSVTDLWTDGIHLSVDAYRELGWNLAALLIGYEGCKLSVSPGSLYWASDRPGIGGQQWGFAAAKGGTGYLTALNPGQAYSLGFYAEEDCRVVIHSVNTASPVTQMSCYYGGGLQPFGATNLTHDTAYGIRQKLYSGLMKRGYRALYIVNDGDGTSFIEGIEFVGREQIAVSRGLLMKSPAMSGIFQPARASSANPFWFTAVDYGTKLSDPCNIVAQVSLSDTYLNGIALFKFYPEFGGGELLSKTMVMAVRNGTNLVLRQLVNGGNDTDTIVANAFPVGVWTGEVELELTGGTMNVYLNGTLTGSRATSQTDGFAGLVADRAARMACVGMWYAGQVKAPY